MITGFLRSQHYKVFKFSFLFSFLLLGNSRNMVERTILYGGLSEWSMVQHSKCCVVMSHPGFESLALRQFLGIAVNYGWQLFHFTLQFIGEYQLSISAGPYVPNKPLLNFSTDESIDSSISKWAYIFAVVP